MSKPEEDLFNKNVETLVNIFRHAQYLVPDNDIRKLARIFANTFPEPVTVGTVRMTVDDIEYEITGLHVNFISRLYQMNVETENASQIPNFNLKAFWYLLEVDAQIWGVQIEHVWLELANCFFPAVLLKMLQTQVS